MTDDDPEFPPRSYKTMRGAPYDPDPGVAAYLAFIGSILIIAIVLLILSLI